MPVIRLDKAIYWVQTVATMPFILIGLRRDMPPPSIVLPSGGELSIASYTLVAANGFPPARTRPEDIFQEAVGKMLARARKPGLELVNLPLGPATQTDAALRINGVCHWIQTKVFLSSPRLTITQLTQEVQITSRSYNTIEIRWGAESVLYHEDAPIDFFLLHFDSSGNSYLLPKALLLARFVNPAAFNAFNTGGETARVAH
jgi:hypothetical protein